MRPHHSWLVALVVTAIAVPARAQDDLDLYTVNIVPIDGSLLRLQFVTTAQEPETCPLVPYDFYVSAETFDEEGFVVDGTIEFTTTVPLDAECVDQVGPWSGSLLLTVGGEFPQLPEGAYALYIDDSFEGDLWVELGYHEFVGDEAFVLP